MRKKEDQFTMSMPSSKDKKDMKNALEFLMKTNDLQKTKRYGNYPPFMESTSEHIFKLVHLVDYFYRELHLNLDYQKCIRLAIYHDFCEMDLEQDVDIKESTDTKTHKSKDIYESEKIEELSEKYYKPIKDYFGEYKDKKTLEAKFINACDKLEAMIHPLTVGESIMNHELFATYADKAITNFPKLMPIYKEIKNVLKTRYREWGFEWKAEYERVFDDYKD